MDAAATLTDLKASGHKLTRVRKALVALFAEQSSPLSAEEVGKLLSRQTLRADRTTIYREITFLKEQGVIAEVEFGDGRKRYEAAQRPHHHHVVCTNCKAVLDVTAEPNMAEQERNIARRSRFKITGHSLEFFGLCAACR